MADAYSLIYDVDGLPRYTGAAWLGLLPTVSVTMSLPWRVNSAGQKLAFDTVDPLQVSHLLEDGRTLYEYYYSFTVHCETQAAAFLVPPTAQSGFQAWSSAECGDFDVVAGITVILRDSIFGAWDGEFADAQVADYAVIDLQLGSGLSWVIAPKVEPGATHTAVAIQDPVKAPHKYTCELEVPFSLSSGLTKSGLNNLPYDVWITKTIQTTVLLTEPLDIGATGEGQEGGQPLDYGSPFDWRLVLIIVFVTVVALAVLYMVLNRKRGGKTA